MYLFRRLLHNGDLPLSVFTYYLVRQARLLCFSDTATPLVLAHRQDPFLLFGEELQRKENFMRFEFAREDVRARVRHLCTSCAVHQSC